MKKKQKKILVCVQCGWEVSGSCDCYFNSDPKYVFCGHCGDSGSHQRFTTAEKWKQARKIMGLSTKINNS